MNQCFTDGGGGGGGGGFLTPHPDVTKTSDFKTDDGQVGGATAVCPEATFAAETGPGVFQFSKMDLSDDLCHGHRLADRFVTI